jgi:hypothetical protein
MTKEESQLLSLVKQRKRNSIPLKFQFQFLTAKVMPALLRLQHQNKEKGI